MFDFVEAYNGNMVAAEGSVSAQVDTNEIGNISPKTADEILQHAREEAAEMLEKAKMQADEYVTQKQVEADEEANRLIALKVNKHSH